MKGLSFYICAGKWAKPRIEIQKEYIRVVLGFVAFAVMFYDLEIFIERLVKHARLE